MVTLMEKNGLMVHGYECAWVLHLLSSDSESASALLVGTVMGWNLDGA